MCYPQWYGGTSLSSSVVQLLFNPFISSVVRWSIPFLRSFDLWYVLSSVVRRYISFIVSGTSMIYPFYIISGTVVYLFHAFSGTLVCVIVNDTEVYLFHRQRY